MDHVSLFKKGLESDSNEQQAAAKALSRTLSFDQSALSFMALVKGDDSEPQHSFQDDNTVKNPSAVEQQSDLNGAEAQYQLGMKALKKNLIDFKKGMTYLYSAAEQGHKLAQYNLGIIFLEGKDVKV